MMALSPGRKERSNTRWMPWLGAIMGAAVGSALRRRSSAKGPGGVDHHFGARIELFAGLELAEANAVDEAFGVLGQVGDACT